MTDELEHIATLIERSKNHAQRVEKLEANFRWVVLTIGALFISKAFDFYTASGFVQ